jgi:hypothetical protein
MNTIVFGFPLGEHHRQQDFERAAFSRNAMGGDGPAVMLDNSPADSQTDAGAFVHVAGMEALEYAENPRTVFLVESYPVVFNDNTALLVG